MSTKLTVIRQTRQASVWSAEQMASDFERQAEALKRVIREKIGAEARQIAQPLIRQELRNIALSPKG